MKIREGGEREGKETGGRDKGRQEERGEEVRKGVGEGERGEGENVDMRCWSSLHLKPPDDTRCVMKFPQFPQG